ncbi:MAG: MMPL family transporter [Planctomycetota bacterium]
MRRYFGLVTSHPILALGAGAVVALVFAPFVFKLTRNTSPDAFIPPDHEALALNKLVEQSFGLVEPIAIGVVRERPGGIFHPDTLRLIQDLTRAIQQLPFVAPDDVLSLANQSGVFFEDGEPGFERLLEEVPETPEGLEALKADVLGYELYRGTLVAADGSAACILIRPHDEKQPDTIYRSLAELLRDFPVRDERLVVAGEPAVRAYMGSAVSGDALRMNLICPVAMAVLIVLTYRTVRGTVLPLCVVGGASLLALGLMGACGIPIYIVTNGIFVVIMALAVDNSFHLIGQYYEEQLLPRGRSKQELIVDACMALWFPVVITSFTDLAGFFGLYVGGMMPPIRYFGVFTCVGVLGALLYAGTIVPAGLMIRPLQMSPAFSKRNAAGEGEAPAEPRRPARREARPPGVAEPTIDLDVFGRMMDWLGAFVFRRRGLVLGAAAVVLAVAGWGASKLVINDARILAFKEQHPIVQASRVLNQHFDGTSHLNIVVTASQPGTLLRPDVLRRIEALEAFTETLPYVGGTHSLAGWVKRAHQKMHEEDPAYYAIPEDPADTRFYLDVLGEKTSPMARLLREVIDPTYTQTNLIVRMRSSEFIHERVVIHALEDYLSRNFSGGPLQAQLAGRVNLDYHWLSLIRTSHLRSVVPSLAWVLVLTGLMFRSVTAGLLCTLTAAVGVVVNYAVMGLGGIPLGVGSSMFASIAIGAGVNFPVHMIDRFRHGFRAPAADPGEVFRKTYAFTGRPLFFTAFVIAAGFLLLCVSEFRTLIEFGLLIGAAMLVSFLASVTLLPALVAVFRPRFVCGRRVRPPDTEGLPAASPALSARRTL